jgi:Xaa-Pro aminopeptidase
MQVRERIQAVRKEMKARGIDAYLVPSTDPHLSEYVPDTWQRRAWVSGFDGSAGEVVITAKRAGLWTDGRYFLQAQRQLEGSGVELMKMGVDGVPTIEEFLVDELPKGAAVGADPQVLSVSRAEGLGRVLKQSGRKLKLTTTNLIDRVWDDRPPMPRQPLRVQATKHAGETVARRLARIRAEMKAVGADAHVLSALDAIMWTTNLRGRDVECNPVAISYLTIERDRATLYVDPVQVTPAVERHLGRHVRLRPYREAGTGLRELASRSKRIWVDAGDCTRWVMDRLKGAELHRATSGVTFMKSRKNRVEQDGMRAAHVRDGVAMVKFLRWLDENIGRTRITEISAADRLEEFRAEGDLFQGLSFRTISGYAAHGAIIHYSVDESTDVELKPRGIYLVDSGAQYLDGTTDITRTVLLGKSATREQKERFTRVLMGHIELGRAKFPTGTRGLRLDTLARMHLWEAGLDYRHGTGHGVGAHLNVHEGPMAIGPRCNGVPLQAGQVLSNEPGYYEDGAYGIRIENLVLVQEDEKLSRSGETWYRFEDLTLCPIEQRLIEPRLLTDAHRKWLDTYHKRVQRTLSPLLGREDKAWLKEACRPL